jgi:hypothetical protein
MSGIGAYAKALARFKTIANIAYIAYIAFWQQKSYPQI